MDTYRAERLIDRRFRLAEGPVWDAETGSLWFVDIKNDMVCRWEEGGGALETVDLCQNVGCMALCESGGFIAATTSGFYRWKDGVLTRLPVAPPAATTRYNDGKCDPEGRFWAGTADSYPTGPRKRGVLNVLSDDRTLTTVADGFGCANGLTFIGDKLYHIDSARHCVERYRVIEGPKLCEHAVVCDIPAPSTPDGMTHDVEGKLWVAHWGGGKVERIDPDTGEVLARVAVPATQSSSCCFGGPDMQTLFITSASVGLAPEADPGAGYVYAARLPIAGVKLTKYKG